MAGTTPPRGIVAHADHETLRWLGPIFATAHLALVIATQPLRWEHVAGEIALALLPWLGRDGRRLAHIALPMFAAAALYDIQRIVLAWRATIHTGDLYALEAALFPVPASLAAAGHHTWPEWLHAHSHAALDVLFGLAYATYLLELLVVALFLYFADEQSCRALAWTFLVTTAMGVVIYLVYPAAPPWYVMQHGHGAADPTVAASPAGAARFDALVGVRYFSSFYARSPNVFGAMPSLHAAFPVITTLYTWKRGRRWRIAMLAYASCVCGAAVYLAHHYIIDVVAGIVVALAAAAMVAWARARLRPLSANESFAREGT